MFNCLIRITATLLACCITGFRTAGILAHTEVQRQAQHFYALEVLNADRDTGLLPVSTWLSENTAFLQPGAFFPDWGYGCLSSDEEAEIAHWPPFLGTAIQHLLKTYPAINSSKSAQELASFLFGTAAHQNTDATWHSIRFPDGLLRIMADLDFRGDYEAAHSILDIGADTILAKQFAAEDDSTGFDYLSATWKVPIRDILEIYSKMQIDISSIKLRYCMTRGFAALSALRRVGSSLSTHYQSKSPFLNNNLADYHLGSFRETSTSTILCWQALEKWIRTGLVPQGDATWQLCEPMQTILRRGKAGPYRRHNMPMPVPAIKPGHVSRANDRSNDGDFEDFENLIEQEMMSIRVTEDESTGIMTIATTRQYAVNPNAVLSKRYPERRADRPYFLTPSNPYAEFGASLSFIESNQQVSLSVGSPRDAELVSQASQGAVYVIPLTGDSNRLPTSEVRDRAWLEPLKSGRACSANSHPFRMTKAAEIPFWEEKARSASNAFFGSATINITLHDCACLAVLSSGRVEIFRMINGSMEFEPHISIKNRLQRNQAYDAPLGTGLYSFKIGSENVLALSSSWDGSTLYETTYLFSERILRQGLLDLTDADLRLSETTKKASGRQPGFGGAISFSVRHQTLFVGYASTRTVSAYKISRTVQKSKKLFEIADPSPQLLDSGFGSSALLALGSFLYIGARTADYKESSQVGAVYVYHMAPLYKKNSARTNVPWIAQLVQEVRPQDMPAFSNFGSLAVHLGAHNVLISAPSYHNRGAIFRLQRFTKRPAVPARRMSLFEKWLSRYKRGQETYERRRFNITLPPYLLGYSNNGAFGKSMIVNSRGQVAIGAPTETGLSPQARLAGKVYLYDGLL